MNFSFIKKVTVLLAISLLLFSCGSKDENNVTIPDNILNEEKFAKIITDFALAESASNINVKNIPSEKADSAYAFDPLVENKVTKAQYDSSIVFYSKHPALYRKIYESVLVLLSKMQVKNDSTKVDSILK
ncbi:MAG: DUF4296 domain-containing protein [Bacteroidetes bacterium]|nr:DUF4296 domain-containing protein [Bacteroidota bacterium]